MEGGSLTLAPGFSPTAAAVCFGTVLHARHSPTRHRFAYPMFFLRLPLSRLEGLDAAVLRINRPGLMRFDFRDHGGRDGGHPLPWIRALLQREGVAAADGEIVLQTVPRLLGYVFNPVSFWFCHDREGGLRAVLCEVNNTFGERHNYLVAHADGRAIAAGDRLRARKAFHVSPFFPVRGEYRFRFVSHGSTVAVAIDYFEDGVAMLSTRLSGRAEPLSDAALVRALLRFPLQTIGVVLRIHLQALRLWVKRVPFFRKPQPPLQETTR